MSSCSSVSDANPGTTPPSRQLPATAPGARRARESAFSCVSASSSPRRSKSPASPRPAAAPGCRTATRRNNKYSAFVTAKALAAIAAAIVIAALPLSPAAAAPTGHGARKHDPTIFESFQVRGSNGYTVVVTLRNRSALTVSATLVDRPSIIAADYKLRVRRAPGSDRIKASLGKLGRIEMRFVPETAYEEEPLFPACKGEMEAVEEGRWVGRFEFRGEHGYTQTRVTRAPGWVGITPAPTCHHR